MAKSIPVFEVIDIAPAAGRPLNVRSTGATVKALEHGVDQVTDSMGNFIEGVQEILARGAKVAGEFEMKTVEVQATIGVEGKIGFLGTSASASGSAQLTITFERRKA
jgi:2',3'-cyclic-nucleotide 2'-phosphodiesterase (5'-nucleotidase family)